jgi:hypothetical protein
MNESDTPAKVGSMEGLGVTRFYARDFDSWIANVCDALPHAPDEPFASAMEIWHRCELPRPAFSLLCRFLKRWAASGIGLERVGCAVGPQFYRYDKRRDHDA